MKEVKPVKDLFIRPFELKDEEATIRLWQRCGLTRPVNDPRKDIRRKSKVKPELFLVGLIDNKIIASVMGGYEGHRGWMNYVGVDPEYRHRGYGRRMVAAVEEKLLALGCPKINLQVRNTNPEAMEFYKKIGFNVDPVTSMGKRLVNDE